MNFQAVEQANGNLVTMFGVFTEVGGITYTTNQKAKCVCKITDDMGAKHNVHLYQGSGQLPGPIQIGTRSEFKVSTFQGSGLRGPYTGYSGFWSSNAQVAPPHIPQGPLQSPQRPKTSKEVDWDAKDLRMARMNAMTNATKLVCLMLEAGEKDPPDMLLVTKTAEGILDYIYNGFSQPGPATPNQAMGGEDYQERIPEPDLPSDEIPF